MSKIVSSVTGLVGGIIDTVIGGVVPDVDEAPPPQNVGAQVRANTTQGNLDKAPPPSPTDDQLRQVQQQSAIRASNKSGRRSTILSTGNKSGKKTTLG